MSRPLGAPALFAVLLVGAACPAAFAQCERFADDVGDLQASCQDAVRALTEYQQAPPDLRAAAKANADAAIADFERHCQIQKSMNESNANGMVSENKTFYLQEAALGDYGLGLTEGFRKSEAAIDAKAELEEPSNTENHGGVHVEPRRSGVGSLTGSVEDTTLSHSQQKAVARMKAGDSGGAVKTLTPEIAARPTPEAYKLRAEARRASGDREGAIADAKKALELDPKDREARSLLAGLEGQSEAQSRAEDVMKGFVPGGRAPADVSGLAGGEPGAVLVGPRAGAPLLGAGPGAGVLPPETGVLVAQARALAAQGRWDEALLALHQAVDQDPKRPELWDLLAEASNQAGDFETAIAAAQKALALDPNDARALRAKAYAELEKGDYAAALADAERAVALDPGNGLGYLYRAMAEEKLGQKAKALADYATAARLDPALAPLADAALARLGGGASGPSRAARLTLFKTGVVGGTGLLILLGLLGTASGRRMVQEYTRRLKTVVAGAPAEEPAGPAIVPEAATAALGARVGGHYRVTGELGRGGMGAVFLALDEKLNRQVAIKQLNREGRGNAEDLARFLDEARLVASLKHPNVVDIYSVVAERDPMLVFEYVEGESLDKVLRRNAKLAPSRARRVVAEVCAALECAHARGIIHRDLKPGNVMIAQDGAARVMDFGIAHRSRGGGTFTRVDGSGTPHYMAPEQESGSVSRASDLYALAVMTYEMLTGARPFAGPAFFGQKLNKEFVAASRMNPALPPGVDAFFDRALDPDPLKRPRTAPEFLKEFDAALEKAASST